MKTIRQGTFETNSSSTHAVSIVRGERDYNGIPVREDGSIYLTGGEFGWQWEKYNDAETKANYCAVDAWNNPERLQMLTDVLKEHTGAKDVVFNLSCDYRSPNWSYIDHQSWGELNQAWHNEENLADFIFCNDSWLYLGNDNDDLEGFYE